MQQDDAVCDRRQSLRVLLYVPSALVSNPLNIFDLLVLIVHLLLHVGFPFEALSKEAFRLLFEHRIYVIVQTDSLVVLGCQFVENLLLYLVVVRDVIDALVGLVQFSQNFQVVILKDLVRRLFRLDQELLLNFFQALLNPLRYLLVLLLESLFLLSFNLRCHQVDFVENLRRLLLALVVQNEPLALQVPQRRFQLDLEHFRRLLHELHCVLWTGMHAPTTHAAAKINLSTTSSHRHLLLLASDMRILAAATHGHMETSHGHLMLKLVCLCLGCHYLNMAHAHATAQWRERATHLLQMPLRHLSLLVVHAALVD